MGNRFGLIKVPAIITKRMFRQVSTFISAFLDNIPLASMMIKIIVTLSTSLNLPVSPMVWVSLCETKTFEQEANIQFNGKND